MEEPLLLIEYCRKPSLATGLVAVEPHFQAPRPQTRRRETRSLNCMPATLLNDPSAAPLADAVTETRNTTCYMCACRCGIRVHLRNGEVRYIEGNPEHPLNQGVICAKGSSGIMKQYSPARLTKPLLRKPGTDRGDGQFEEIEWEEVFSLLEQRLQKIRSTDPKQFALFTGRDQMQALTGLFARQFLSLIHI